MGKAKALQFCVYSFQRQRVAYSFDARDPLAGLWRLRCRHWRNGQNRSFAQLAVMIGDPSIGPIDQLPTGGTRPIRDTDRPCRLPVEQTLTAARRRPKIGVLRGAAWLCDEAP